MFYMDKKLNKEVLKGFVTPKSYKSCKKSDDGEVEDYTTLKGRNVCRQGNHIYFYDSIDDETQMWLQQSMNAAYEEAVINNAREITKTGSISDNVYIHINSPGGSVTSSLALYDFIKTFPVAVVGIVEGIAASGASVLLCGCQLREMTESSSVLVHELRSWDPSVKKWSEIKDDYENNKYLMDKVKSIYLKETLIPQQTIDDVLSHDVYWDAEKCIEYELCDVIVGRKLTESLAQEIDKKVEKRFGRESDDFTEETEKKSKKLKKSKDLKKDKDD